MGDKIVVTFCPVLEGGLGKGC